MATVTCQAKPMQKSTRRRLRVRSAEMALSRRAAPPDGPTHPHCSTEDGTIAKTAARDFLQHVPGGLPSKEAPSLPVASHTQCIATMSSMQLTNPATFDEGCHAPGKLL